MSTETLLREHLEVAAQEVVLDSPPLVAITGRVRRSRVVMGMSAAAVLVVSVVAVGLLRGDQEQLLSSSAAASEAVFDSEITELLPRSFDAFTAVPLFALDGGPEAVAVAYLESRLPNYETLGIEIVTVAAIDDLFSAVRWARGNALSGEEDPTVSYFAGWILLRQLEDGSSGVVAATTDRVDTSEMFYEDDRVYGEIVSTQVDSMSLDILDLDGAPVPSAPFPVGFSPDAVYRFATAGVADTEYPGETHLPFDLTAVTGPVAVRANLVGGTLLSVSEVVLPAPIGQDGMVLLLEDSIVATEDGSLRYATAPAPEARFEPPGAEIVLDPSIGWEELDTSMLFREQGTPRPAGPVVYVGTQGNHQVIAFETVLNRESWVDGASIATTSACVAHIDITTLAGGMGCGYGESEGVSWGASGPEFTPVGERWLFIFEFLGRDASVVVFETPGGVYWQRPVGGMAVFDSAFTTGESVGVVTVYDDDGTALATETINLEP